MTLKRLLIVLSVLIVLAGGGMFWLARVAYTPQGRARIIIAQLKGDTTSLHGWLLKHHVVKQGFSEPPAREDENQEDPRIDVAADEMVKLGLAVLPIVIEAVRDETPEVRVMAIRACGDFRDPAALQPLVKCLRDATEEYSNTGSLPTMPGGNMDVQYSCMVALAKIGPVAYGPLMEVSRKGCYYMRHDIPATVAGESEATAIPKLLELLENPDEVVRAGAAEELGNRKDKRSVDALIRHLVDGEAKVAVQAAYALGDIGDHKAIPSLLKILDDMKIEEDVRIVAAATLARMGRDEGLKFLLTMLNSSSEENRNIAVGELGKYKDRRATDALIGMLGNPGAVAAAAAALGEIGDRKAIGQLLKALNDSQNVNFARISAAGALARLGRDEGLKYLLAMLKSTDSGDRAESAEALGKTQIEGMFGPLLPLAGDKDAEVRHKAVEAIGELCDPHAIPAVRKLLNDTDPDVRVYAAAALQKLDVKTPPASQPDRP